MKKYKMYQIIWESEDAKEAVLWKAFSETTDRDYKAKKALYQAWHGQHEITFTAWNNFVKAVKKVSGGVENVDSEEW